MLEMGQVFLLELVSPYTMLYTLPMVLHILVHVFLEHASECYNTSAVARAVAIGCSEVALQVNVSVVRAKNIRE